jgi:phosphotransacetylase
MERIVIEVSPNVARAWRNASPEKRKKMGDEMGIRIGKKLLKSSKEEYLQYIDQLQKTMKERGLTQEILDEILNED